MAVPATAFDATYTLEDKYTRQEGRIYLSGVQALVRLPLMQQMRDRAAGLNTAGFISGYRGSPLGGFDLELWKARKHLEASQIKFTPGLNEDLGATMVWGTQQVGLWPGAKQDGVFAMWYGKGPGVDRCGDVFKHGNAAGTHKHGGVLALAADDHACRSSTLPHGSELEFVSAMMPILNPAGVQDILDMGMLGWAMSRFTGRWVGFKTIAETVESSASVNVNPHQLDIILPEDFELPPGGLNIRWPDPPLNQEMRLHQYAVRAATAFARANKIDKTVIDSPRARLGIITTGKSYLDVLQALEYLGLDRKACEDIGIRVYKVGMTWPLEPIGMREFARGLEDIIVVEEKRSFIESQMKELMYNWDHHTRPSIVGKYNEQGDWILPSTAELTPAMIAQVIASRVQKFFNSEKIDDRLKWIAAKEQELTVPRANFPRVPHYCSGCPHNSSTKVPEGSRALGGIGCHYMVTWMNRSTDTFTQMGGEGVTWCGQAPFTDTEHVFQNLGDGTYFHSGSLAIRQAIAAKVNITYKILYNDAVAMTGGQQVGERPEGHSVVQIAQSMRAEGAVKITIVTDEPEKYGSVKGLPEGIAIQHRDTLDAVQREFREIKGTTVIIYDQTCATEKRRRRKRGTLVDPAKRVVINELVCEGCGDCGVQSNCLSVEPLETEFGRKRTINQSTCNKDYSCLKGFCPSFVTVEGGQLRKKDKGGAKIEWTGGTLPHPALPALGAEAWGVIVAGVGGTGVITIGQLLGVAAHLEGKGIVTQDAAGLAQKGGATWSHVLIGARQDDIRTTRVSAASADLVLGCDPIVSANKETWQRLRAGRTHVAVNVNATPTAAFVKNPDWQNPAQACVDALVHSLGADAVGTFDAETAATRLMGDSLYTNPMMLGYAWQKGWLPLELESLMRAIELNAVQIDKNKAAFEWGRRAAHDPQAVAALWQKAGSGEQVIQFRKRDSLDELIARRVEFLTGYQNAAYAAQYRSVVERVRAAEAPLGKSALTEAVVRYLFKLMAYKDEYEVARLHSDPAFHARLANQFEGDYKLRLHLAPPLIARKNERGELVKRPFGPAMFTVFKVLARLKGLRGTALDVFGRTEERRTERALIVEYRADIEALLTGLNADNHALAVDIACVPEQIKGFGHVKARHLAAARTRRDNLLQQWRQPAQASDLARAA